MNRCFKNLSADHCTGWNPVMRCFPLYAVTSMQTRLNLQQNLCGSYGSLQLGSFNSDEPSSDMLQVLETIRDSDLPNKDQVMGLISKDWVCIVGRPYAQGRLSNVRPFPTNWRLGNFCA